MTEESCHNILGAVVFWTYIAAALSITVVILRSISKSYENSTQTHSKKLSTNPRSLGKKRLKQSATFFLGLAVISFTLLTRNMLGFLIISFTGWSGPASTNLAAIFNSIENMSSAIVRIWKWSTCSTLFLDFAESLCSSPGAMWWTRQALIYSLAWNGFMAVAGKSE